MANIKGTSRGDRLRGTEGGDRIQGQGGDDFIFALGGNDVLEGGTGNDTLQGGAGSDTLEGGGGTDTADYSERTTGVRVRLENLNRATTDVGTAEELATDGSVLSTDTLISIENVTGGVGNDSIDGNQAANVLVGGSGHDCIFGGTGDDFIYGGEGDDLLDGDQHNDHIDGGAGTDTLFWRYGTYGDTIIDLAAGTVRYLWGPIANIVDTLVSIENVRGGGDDDSISGDGVANVLVGSSGNDVIAGRGGNDLLIGDFGRRLDFAFTGGSDVLNGGDGDDILVGDVGNDLLSGGSGADRFEFDLASGHDRITDFESGIDSVALFGGLSIASWEMRDSDGDGAADSQTAILSDGSTIMFVGLAEVPEVGLTMSAAGLHYADLAIW